MAIDLLLLLFSTMIANPPADRPVARFAGVTILYKEIATDRTKPISAIARKWHPGATDDEIYHAYEQERLHLRIVRLALDFAASRDGIQPTQQEIDDATPPRARDEEAHRKSFEVVLAEARSARRVLRGAR